LYNISSALVWLQNASLRSNPKEASGGPPRPWFQTTRSTYFKEMIIVKYQIMYQIGTLTIDGRCVTFGTTNSQ